MNLNRNARFAVECPNGHPISVTLAELEATPIIVCSTCEAQIDASGFVASVQKTIDQSVKRFGQTAARVNRQLRR
jgi:hypothetical protein